MKKFYLILSMVLGYSAYSQTLIEQNFPTENGKILYTEVVQVDSSLSKTDLYFNANEWLTKTFRDANEVIQTEDKEAGLIVGKGFFKKGHNAYVKNPQNWFVVKIECKNGKYKYSITNIRYKGRVEVMGAVANIDDNLEDWANLDYSKMKPKKKQQVDELLTQYFQELDAEFKSMITSLKTDMVKQAKSDW